MGVIDAISCCWFMVLFLSLFQNCHGNQISSAEEKEVNEVHHLLGKLEELWVKSIHEKYSKAYQQHQQRLENQPNYITEDSHHALKSESESDVMKRIKEDLEEIQGIKRTGKKDLSSVEELEVPGKKEEASATTEIKKRLIDILKDYLHGNNNDASAKKEASDPSRLPHREIGPSRLPHFRKREYTGCFDKCKGDFEFCIMAYGSYGPDFSSYLKECKLQRNTCYDKCS